MICQGILGTTILAHLGMLNLRVHNAIELVLLDFQISIRYKTRPEHITCVEVMLDETVGFLSEVCPLLPWYEYLRLNRA